MEQKILVVDDEQRMRKLVKDFLVRENFTVLEAADGEEAVDVFLAEKNIDLIILDVMMPKMDGWQVCREIRQYSKVPIIMLTARGAENDELRGFELGVDEYISKPFSPKILVARVQAILRRTVQAEETPAGATSSKKEDTVKYEDLEVSLSGYTVIYKGHQIEMPPKELELLYFLASQPNQVFTREQLLDKIWGYDYIGDTRTVDVHVKRIREKIKDGKNWSVTTVWGIGYKFEVK